MITKRQLSILGLAFLFVVTAVSLSFAAKAHPKVSSVDLATVEQWMKDGQEFKYIDVRESSEFKSGHLGDALNIPYYEIEKMAEELPTDMPLVIYGQFSAWRAPYAANTLRDLGLTNLYVLARGIDGSKDDEPFDYTKMKFAPLVEGDDKKLTHPEDTGYRNKLSINRKRLAYYDGKNGRPAFVAVNGTVYDLTQSRLWRGGSHDPAFGDAWVGKDLTDLFQYCPNGEEHLKNFPVVGKLIN